MLREFFNRSPGTGVWEKEGPIFGYLVAAPHFFFPNKNLSQNQVLLDAVACQKLWIRGLALAFSILVLRDRLHSPNQRRIGRKGV